MVDLAALGQAFGEVLGPLNLALIALGVVVGVVAAAVPGLTGAMAIALLLPMTFTLSPISSLCLLIGCYKGSQFGGSIPAILIGVPGAPEASATLLDGYPLAQRGYPLKALKAALYGSVLADAYSDVILIVAAGTLAPLALGVGPPEKFALVLLALTLIVTVTEKSPLKGGIAAVFGLLLATAGMDPITASVRFTFGRLEMLEGLALVPLMLGLFAIPVLINAAEGRMRQSISVVALQRAADDRLSWNEFRGLLWTILRSGTVGALIGAAPAVGSGPAAFIAYGLAKSRSKNPEEFGKGSLHGIAAAEAGNSGTVGATLIPVLTLGIPGSGIAALFMAAFLIQGIPPGPTIFADFPVVVYGMFIAFLIGNLFNWLIGELALPLGRYLLSLNPAYLYPIVFVLCIVGTYGVAQRMFDVNVMFGVGIMAYAMDRLAVPVIPTVIAFVLGGLAEQSLRQSLLMFDQSPLGFFSRPVVVVLFVIAAANIAYSGVRIIRQANQRGRKRGADA